MRKTFIIAIFVLVGFILESVLGQALGRWFKPNLLIILVVFFNLFRGSEAGIVAAFFAGLLQDSYSAKFFGLNIFSYVACANLVTLTKLYLYQVGSTASRVLMVFLMTLAFGLIQYAIHVMFEPVFFSEVMRNVLLPEVVATTLVTPYVFEKAKQCALRLFA